MADDFLVAASALYAGTAMKRTPETWTDFSLLRWTRVDIPHSRMSKIELAKFPAVRGMPCVRILAHFESAGHICLKEAPGCFVLKPTSMWSGRGVRLLHRIAGVDFYFDAKNRVVLPESRIIESAREMEENHGKKVPHLIEERVFDEAAEVLIPFDYKVFTFHGVAKFILQVDRNHAVPRMCFFTGGFEPIVDDRVVLAESSRLETQGVHRIPKCAKDIVALAEEITLRMKAPFISVDCYASQRGAVLGELTHTPGGPWFGDLYRFSDEFDRELGREWMNACQRLNIAVPQIEAPYEIRQNGKIIRVVE